MMYENYDFTTCRGVQIDIETHDPNLAAQGSGVYRKDGYILGVAIGDIDGGPKAYFPLAHPDTTKKEEAKNLKIISDVLKSPIQKLGASIKYDLDWLVNGYGMKVEGELHDIQIAEPLLDEYRRSYSLESLSQYYLGQGKKDESTYQWCVKHGIKLKKPKDAVKHLAEMPSDVVGPYALGDVSLPGEIFKIQKLLLDRQGLWDLYEMEMSLVPVLLQMRKTGVRIDKNKMLITGMNLSDAILTGEQALFKKIGREVNIKSTLDVKWMMDKYGLEYPHNPPTAKMKEKGIVQGNPCLNKDVLASHKHWLTKSILDLRHMKTLNSMFIRPYMGQLTDGRLHGDFNQLRSNDSGTVSGRLSGSNPNLQQVSGKDEPEDVHPLLAGKIIRDLFIPEEGMDWLKHDWSQIEYRLIAHYARGPRSEEIRERYRSDPKTDYHTEMGKMTGLGTGKAERKVVKTLNFGAAYGMGWRTMSKKYGWSAEYAQQVYEMYHKKVPFIKTTAEAVAYKAKTAGFIKTVLGRRARLNDPDKGYVMFNRLIQGSAADLMKLAMVQSYEMGLFDVLPVHLNVHDELGNSMPRTEEGREAAKELKHTMETCIKLRVPILADAEVGPSWGNLKDFVA